MVKSGIELYFGDSEFKEDVDERAKEVRDAVLTDYNKAGKLVGRLAYGTAWTIITRGAGVVVGPAAFVGDAQTYVENGMKERNLSFEQVYEKTLTGD